MAVNSEHTVKWVEVWPFSFHLKQTDQSILKTFRCWIGIFGTTFDMAIAETVTYNLMLNYLPFFLLTIYSHLDVGRIIDSISIWRKLSMFDETMQVALNMCPVAKMNMVNSDTWISNPNITLIYSHASDKMEFGKSHPTWYAAHRSWLVVWKRKKPILCYLISGILSNAWSMARPIIFN